MVDFFKLIFDFYLLILAISFINGSLVNDLNKGLTEFANDFYLHCVNEQPGNVIISPLSVPSALTLLSQGADGDTYDQLIIGLHLNYNKSITLDQFFDNRKTLEQNAGETTLSIANGIYVQQGRQFNEVFQNIATSIFQSDIETLDFVDAEKSANTINHYVEEKTHGKIKDLIKSDQFGSDTRSVLVNAIHFKGAWEKPFSNEYTSKQDFYNSETEKVPVDFMYMNGRFNSAYLKDLEATALEMKYANSNISFVIVLPESRMGLTTLETKLKNYDLATIAENLNMNIHDLYIPKFKVEYEIKLNNILKKMGMAEIFSNSANLMGLLNSGEQLKISDAVHKAIITIDENGSEASSGTGMIGVLGTIPKEFRADHPFMYFIREITTNTIIFTGRIARFV